jgi:hypothetical protein
MFQWSASAVSRNTSYSRWMSCPVMYQPRSDVSSSTPADARKIP